MTDPADRPQPPSDHPQPWPPDGAPPPAPLPPPGWQRPDDPSRPPMVAGPPTAPSGPVGHAPPPAPPGPGYPTAPPAYGYPGSPAGYTPWAQMPKNDGMAIAALSCGIASIPLVLFCFIGGVVGIVALVLGLVSMGRISKSGGYLTGRGMALAGSICGGVGIGLSGLWLALIIASS
jgi:hypothetical protein